jgi:hypothetical protein
LVSYQDAVELKKELESEYGTRHEAMKRLRQYWHGEFWKLGESDQRSVSSIFADLTKNANDVGPDLKLVHNLVQEICVKFQTYLSPLPMIRVYADGGKAKHRNQATMKERFLYGSWSENRASQHINSAAWYLPLMGSCFHGIFPDFERNIPRMMLRSPEYAYPIPSAEFGEDGVIFCWETSPLAAKRAWPKYSPREAEQRGRFRIGKRSKANEKVQVLEYSDGREFARWVDGQRVNGVEHGFGFSLFEHMKFINVPDEVFGHGAVEQVVNLNEMGNALLSLLFQAVMENVFPQLVLIDPSKAPEEIHKGPGAVLPINQGGDAKYLTPPLGALGTQTAWLQENERQIKQGASMPAVNFGSTEGLGSIVTGKAINELQGAGTGSTVEMVQGTGLGTALVSWNEKAIFMAQHMFKDEKIKLFGLHPATGFDLAPKTFGLELYGRDLKGSQRNEVVFMPHVGMHEKIVMGLQMAGAGLVSKQWQREQVGIPDSQAMEEEIVSESLADAVIQSLVQAMLQGGAETGAALDLESKIHAMIQGQTPANGGVAPSPTGPALPGMPPGLPPGLLGPPGAAQAAGQPGPLPAQPPVPSPPDEMGMAAAPAGQPSDDAITLDQALEAFSSLQGIEGRVFLIGEIVEQGQTDDELEVAITEGSDRQRIADQLPEFAGRMLFRSVPDVPGERYYEVTPGSTPAPGGLEEPEIDFLEA